MTLEPRAKRLLDMLAVSSAASPGRLSTEARREGFAKLMEIGSRPVAIARSEDITMEMNSVRIPIRLYDARPDETGSRSALVFFHGGGLVAGSIDTHDGICRALANSSGAIVFSVGYRLAPEAKYPAALNDSGYAVDWIADQAIRFGIDPQRIALGGESAGCLLATLTCNGYQVTRVRARAQLLLCPVIDLTGKAPSRKTFARGYLVDESTIARDIEDCLETGQHPHDLPSPLRQGVAAETPPTVIVSAECDPFRDEAAQYETLLAASGVPVRHTCYLGMVHSFYGLNGLLPQATVALDEAGRQLAAALCRQG